VKSQREITIEYFLPHIFEDYFVVHCHPYKITAEQMTCSAG